jgi:hypothetical protein
MKRFTSRKAVAVVAAGLVVAGGGSALAASGSGSGTSFLDRVAQKLGISSEKLRDATKAAAIDQIDEQLKAGTITKEQADAMKKRVESGQFPGLGRGFGDRGFGHHGFGRGMGGPGLGGPGPGGPGGHLADAATYLGLTQAKLMDQLQAGKTLADVAKAQGKTVEGLKDALLASEKKELDALVKAGTITQAQADSALADRKSRLDDMVNGTFRGGHGRHAAPGMGHGFGDRDGDHGPVMPGGQRMMPGGASLGAPA